MARHARTKQESRAETNLKDEPRLSAKTKEKPVKNEKIEIKTGECAFAIAFAA